MRVDWAAPICKIVKRSSPIDRGLAFRSAASKEVRSKGGIGLTVALKWPEGIIPIEGSTHMMETAATVEIKNAPTVEKTREIIQNELRHDLGEWMMAKEDLVWRPAVELTKEGGEFAARFLVPGLRTEDVEILVSPERILIKGNQFLRSVEFPRPVNPDKVHAEIAGGMLSVRARIAEPGNVVMFKPRAA